ncbi:MAG: carboxymuconolactone decarboxylase family protein [Spirochaetaceae bacterium]|nr:carboxymuconolactone decarboxylase family protein [Spirochaetaceae bacterium]
MNQDESERNSREAPQHQQDRLPGFLNRVIADYPDVWRAYRILGDAAAAAGPLDARSQRLVKLALAVGARSQGAVHSHARRALREGVPATALLQVPLLAVSSIGWSAAMAALAWVRDVTDAPAS